MQNQKYCDHMVKVYDLLHKWLVLQVKPVSYLMIKSETVLHSVPGMRLTAFPTAMTIRLSVSFHDDVGVEFYATSSRVRFRLHKYIIPPMSQLYGIIKDMLITIVNLDYHRYRIDDMMTDWSVINDENNSSENEMHFN